MASHDRRRRRKRVFDLVFSGLREFGGSGVTVPQLTHFLAARHGEAAVPRKAVVTVLRRAARLHLVEDRHGRCGCKPKRVKRKSCSKKKKKKARSKCRKGPGIVKRLMKIIFKKRKSKCKCPPKKRRPRGCSSRRRRPRC